MYGLTALGRGVPSAMGYSSGDYSRENVGGSSFSPLRTHFQKAPMQFLQEDNENLPDIAERLNAINRESDFPFARKDNFHNVFMQGSMPSSGFMPVNEAFSGSYSNNNISFNASVFGNDALQIIGKIQSIISSPEEYKRHKENGTLPTDKDLKPLADNMLGQLRKLAAEKTGVNDMPDSGNIFGSFKDMLQQNIQRKNNDIQKLIGTDTVNPLSQDVSGLQDALKNMSGIPLNNNSGT